MTTTDTPTPPTPPKWRPEDAELEESRMEVPGAHFHRCPVCDFDWSCLYEASTPCIFTGAYCEQCIDLDGEEQ